MLPCRPMRYDDDIHRQVVSVIVDGEHRKGFLLGEHIYHRMIQGCVVRLSRFQSLMHLLCILPTPDKPSTYGECALCTSPEKVLHHYCSQCYAVLCDDCAQASFKAYIMRSMYVVDDKFHNQNHVFIVF